MIYVYDELTKQNLYINKYHVIFITSIESFKKYELHLTDGSKVRVDYSAVNKIRKRLL